MRKIKFADLFSGCGGFSLGFHEIEHFELMAAVDNWSAAADTYVENFPDANFLTLDLSDCGNKTRLIDRLADECDVLIGGPPCQGFSTLGKRRDGDERSTLVDHFADLAVGIRPRIILMENVKGITSKQHPMGRTYAERLIEALEQCPNPYKVTHRLVDARWFGMAQTRTRWLMFAVRRDFSEENSVHDEFWRLLERGRDYPARTLAQEIGDLPRVPAGGGSDELFLQSDAGDRVVYNHKSMRHSPALIERFRHVPPGGGLLDVPRHLLTSHLRKMLDGHYGSGGHVKNIYGRLEWDKPCGTIVAGMDKITCGRFLHPEEDRLLTPRECARIQSFPDYFRFKGGLVTQYYLVGNAVPPNLGRAAASAVARVLSQQTGGFAINRQPMPIERLRA